MFGLLSILRRTEPSIKYNVYRSWFARKIIYSHFAWDWFTWSSDLYVLFGEREEHKFESGGWLMNTMRKGEQQAVKSKYPWFQDNAQFSKTPPRMTELFVPDTIVFEPNIAAPPLFGRQVVNYQLCEQYIPGRDVRSGPPTSQAPSLTINCFNADAFSGSQFLLNLLRVFVRRKLANSDNFDLSIMRLNRGHLMRHLGNTYNSESDVRRKRYWYSTKGELPCECALHKPTLKCKVLAIFECNYQVWSTIP
jgi:hypothetical protein